MKKSYIAPEFSIEEIDFENMMAASKFDVLGGDTQSIEVTDEEYEGEFSVKQSEFLWDE